MKNLFYIYLAVSAVVLFLYSCSPGSDADTISGKHIMIEYSGTELVDGDWIEIDGVRFVHLDYLPDLQANPFSLPASLVSIDTTETYSQLKEPFAGMAIGLELGNRLEAVNRVGWLSADHDHLYEVTRRALLMTRGTLTIQREDSSAFQIRTSPGYPAQITVLE